MTYTYAGNPSTSTLAFVRFKLQDVALPWKFTDEEINAILAVQPLPLLASAQLCEVLAVRYADQVDYTNGALAEQASQRAAAWTARAKALRDEVAEEGRAGGVVRFLVGGQTLQEREDRALDDEVTQPDFGQGMLDNPGRR